MCNLAGSWRPSPTQSTYQHRGIWFDAHPDQHSLAKLIAAQSKSALELNNLSQPLTDQFSKTGLNLRDRRSRSATLTGKAIQQETLEVLVRDQALRELRAIRMEGGWCLEGRIALQWRPVRSRRESIRVWRSLTALERFCTSVGIKRLTVEL